MTTMTAQDVMARIEAEASKNAPEVRDMRDRMELPGDVARQGDVYVWRLPDGAVAGTERGTRQVAVGATVGSRHIAEGPVTLTDPADVQERIKALRAIGATDAMTDVMVGPVVHATGEWCLTHPEHAHIRFPAGTFNVTYQMDERTRQAVRD